MLRLDRYLYGLEQCERGRSPRPRTRRIARHANYLCVPGGCHDNTAWGPRGDFTHKIGEGYGADVVDVLSDLGRERLDRQRARGVEFEF